MKCSMPACRASSTTCWISGRSTTVSISFGIALVAGRKRVPRPATGKMALRIRFIMRRCVPAIPLSRCYLRSKTMRPVGRPWESGRPLTVLQRYPFPIGSVDARDGDMMQQAGSLRIAVPAILTASLLFGCAGETGSPLATQSVGARSYAQAVGPSDWSGQSGASGHPQMSADAIRADAANFNQCLANLWPEAARRGVSRQVYDAQTQGLTPDLKIMDLVDAQPEFTKAFWEY